MKYYCLFNPMAGNEKSAEKIKKLPEIFPDADVVRYDVTKTPYAEIFPLLDKDDKIILCGGDGTLNRFVNSVDVLPKNDVYLFATGTGNDFLTDVGGDKDKPVLIND